MRKEVKALHAKAVDSLILAVDHFNRAWDRGRVEAVLILLDRAFELLLKAGIVHRGGAIREKGREGITIGFDLCLRKCLSDASLACLTEDEVFALQSLNTLRDAAQHYLIELSEEHLYVHAQAALSLFGKLTREVFGRPLDREVPQRILPVCAKPPSDLPSLFDVEFADIKRMVAPGQRKRLMATAKLRALSVLEGSLSGRKTQPADAELDATVKRINAGDDWRTIFPGVATLRLEQEATGPGLSLRITRNKGEAVQIVAEGTPDATVMAVRKVNDLDFYNMGLRDLARKLRVSMQKLHWLVGREGLQSNPDFFKQFQIGSQAPKRYSGLCHAHLTDLLSTMDLDAAYAARKNAGA